MSEIQAQVFGTTEELNTLLKRLWSRGHSAHLTKHGNSVIVPLTLQNNPGNPADKQWVIPAELEGSDYKLVALAVESGITTDNNNGWSQVICSHGETFLHWGRPLRPFNLPKSGEVQAVFSLTEPFCTVRSYQTDGEFKLSIVRHEIVRRDDRTWFDSTIIFEGDGMASLPPEFARFSHAAEAAVMKSYERNAQALFYSRD